MEKPNLDYVKTLAGGESSFEARLINIIRTELPEEISVYNRHLDEGQLDLAAQSVHKLKHKISILGMTKAYELTVTYEEELKIGNSGKADRFREVLDSMSRFINDLNL